MSYSKSLEMKIIRTKHVVSFYDGTQAIDLLNDLERVPKEARVVDFINADDNDPVDVDAKKQHMIVFELEEKA